MVLDLVGGAMFAAALVCLAVRESLAEIGTGGRWRVEFDIAVFDHDEGRLFGVDSLKRDPASSAGPTALAAPAKIPSMNPMACRKCSSAHASFPVYQEIDGRIRFR